MNNKKEQDRQYYLANRRKIIDRSIAWKRNNKDRANAWSRTYRKGRSRAAEARAYRAKHPEAARAANKRSYARHAEKRRAGAKVYRAKHRDRINEYQRKWRIKNWVTVLEKKRLKRLSDVQYAIETRLRAHLIKAVLRRHTQKADSTLNLLGCSIPQFVSHLESLFLPGMSWENRHLWHIDHIKPVALFDLTDAEQQRQCFHYSNLQPLWAKDNRVKQDNFISYRADQAH